MSSNILNRQAKLKIYRSLVRLVLTYGKRDKEYQGFLRKIIMEYYGPLRINDGTFSIRTHYELEQLVKGGNIVRQTNH